MDDKVTSSESCKDDIDSGESQNAIKAINKDAVHRICSGQVVLNLAISVKELVENAIDAGATIVEVRLKDYGKELVEVLDNGSGVLEENFSGLTLKYHTSKLRDFCDLLSVSTFGFRGEALSSLCSLADVTVTTKHSSSAHGTRICYDHKGNIVSSTPCARQIGTTVSIANLFSSLPVRQKEFHRNHKREFNKMTQLLYAYCLVSERVKITCTNQTSQGNKSIVVATQGGSLRDNIASVFGVKQLQTLLELKSFYPASSSPNMKKKFFKNLETTEKEDLSVQTDHQDVSDIKSDEELHLSEDSNDENNLSQLSVASVSQNTQNEIKKPFEFVGYLSSCAHGSGRSTSDRQFYFINSRPCEPTKIMKLVNEVYKQYNPNQYPFVYLDVKLKHSSVDVNVTPDKRKVFLNKENHLLDVVKASLLKCFENIPSCVKLENVTQNTSRAEELPKNAPRIFSSFLSQFSNKNVCESTKDVQSKTKETKRKSYTLTDFGVSVKKKKNCDETMVEIKADDDNDSVEQGEDSSNYNINVENSVKHNPKVEDSINRDLEVNCNSKGAESFNDDSKVEDSIHRDLKIKDLDDAGHLSDEVIEDINVVREETNVQKGVTKLSLNKYLDVNNSSPINGEIKEVSEDESDGEKTKKSVKVILDDCIEKQPVERNTVNVNVSMDIIRSLIEKNNILKNENKLNLDRVKFRSEINPTQNKSCEDELKKELSKDMFKAMRIVGQFNLGFIVTQLERDLFIIDQHATDEKYNFETLQRTTVLSNQRLVIPKPLDLSGVCERILMDNLEVFRHNGFTFEIDEAAPPTSRVKLLTIPISKNTVFGKEDIDELLFMLKEAPNEMCRPSRVRAMFASRACRKSVMIGTALSKADMRRLVDNMGLIEHPWNCPHGRPTIRHLINLGLIDDKLDS